MDNFIFGVSLTTSFMAGMLALFAPCCITFLFPSYLGTIFKEGKKVMFYTLIFALGIGSILIPVALGFKFFIFFFDDFHKEIYYLGALFLIFMGIMTIKPLFTMPQLFNFNLSTNRKINTGSVFALGIMSGLTSSCCAPVLFAAVTLTTLSPTILQALIVSFAYVLGIVFPLFIMSIFYQSTAAKISGAKRHKIHKILSIIGGSIFIISGILIAIANYFNKIQMYQMEGYSKALRLQIFQFSKYFSNPIFDIITFLLIIFIFYKLLKKYYGKNHSPSK